MENGKQTTPELITPRRIIDSTATGNLWVQCPSCGKKSRAKEVFCYQCGALLQTIKGQFDTLLFVQKTDYLLDKKRFDSDSILVLETNDSAHRFEIRPQLARLGVLIGRGSGIDVDLTPSNAINLGVSRQHLTLTFDKHNEMLYIQDSGSANGTYLNGGKLHAGEKRVLTHGDELQLGRLILNIQFLYLGDKL